MQSATSLQSVSKLSHISLRLEPQTQIFHSHSLKLEKKRLIADDQKVGVFQRTPVASAGRMYEDGSFAVRDFHKPVGIYLN